MQPINPINYRIHIVPDLTGFEFGGRCELAIEAKKPVTEVKLDILELAIWTCRIRLDGNLRDCPFKIDPEKEKVVIFLPEPLSGTLNLEISYRGIINDRMAGFYRSRYTSRDRIRYIAVTQFEESDARRAFPCIDHPGKKATFDISMDIPKDLVAISNTPVKSEDPIDNDQKRIAFEQTPKMSTYLVFFGVGEFEFTVDQKDRRVRVATLPGMQEFARFGLEFGRKSLEFSESYYGIDYPLDKMDLIAIPDFAFGAMENWGAITFRENLLLHYPNITSRSGEERICEVIAHEIAHQWFGNLVTPSDWRYLWLNESFATYFGFGVVDHYYPRWKTWQQFLHSMTGSALVRDGLHETFAIEIPGGEHVVINASTAPIIYNKGGSILRQIQGYIGDDNFKEGLRHYLKTYEYECAASHHLWEAFETVSRQPVSSMMQSWIEQPGYPLVTAHREDRQLRLSQERFTYLPNEFDQKWQIPINICLFLKDGTIRQISLLLSESEQTVDVEDDVLAYKVNDRQTGFYRVMYRNAENIIELGKLVQHKLVSPEDRWGIQNDMYAMVKSGRSPLGTYLEFIENYDREDAYLPLASIAENLYSAYITVNSDDKEKIAATAVPKLEALLSRIGYDPTPEEDHPTALLRDQVIWDAALYGSDASRDFVRRQFTALKNGDPVHPDIMKSVLQAGALDGDEEAFEWFDQRLQTSQVEHERMNILTAMGCFKDPAVIKKAQQYLLDNVPARNQFIPVVAMCANPHAIGLMWNWYVSNLKRIEAFHPMLYERVVAAIIPVAGIERPDEVKTFFERYRSQKDVAKDVINLSLERLEINLRLRNNIQ